MASDMTGWKTMHKQNAMGLGACSGWAEGSKLVLGVHLEPAQPLQHATTCNNQVVLLLLPVASVGPRGCRQPALSIRQRSGIMPCHDSLRCAGASALAGADDWQVTHRPGMDARTLL